MFNNKNKEDKEKKLEGSYHEMANTELMNYFREQLQIQAQVIDQLRNRLERQDSEIKGLREEIYQLKEYFDSKL